MPAIIIKMSDEIVFFRYDNSKLEHLHDQS